MIDNERAAVEAVRKVVHAYDRGARVFVAAREYAQAQPVCSVTIAVVTRVDYHDLIDAVVEFCVASAGDYRLERTQADVTQDVGVDVYEITTKIYKRG